MIQIENAKISLKNFKEDLITFGQFDSDANGMNGEDFLEDEAKKHGFKTNLEYWAYEAEKAFNTQKGSAIDKLRVAVAIFMVFLDDSWNPYCKHTGYKVEKAEDEESVYAIFAYSED